MNEIEQAIKNFKGLEMTTGTANIMKIPYQLAIEALDMQMAKKILCEVVDESGKEYEYEHYKCPYCKAILHQRYKHSKEPMRYKQNYCAECGQKLDWSDEE